MQLSRRAAILGLAATCINPARAFAAGKTAIGGLAFGSSWRVTTDTQSDRAQVKSVIEAVVAEVNAAMSPFRPDSDLSRFNASASVDWQAAPSRLCNVASAALRVAKLTGGAFDPTVGPLVSRYGFGPIEGSASTYTALEIGEETLRKKTPQVTLDLCGIAKGYALDRIVDGLIDAGIENALVELGGEVKAIGRHPGNRDWQIAVADPNAGGFRARSVITPGSNAVATSGHSANGQNGRFNVSHIIDPHRGRPAPTSLASVTALAKTAMDADAFATAFCSSGLAQGVAAARRLNVSALFISTDASAGSDVMTGAFAQHILT